MSDLDLSEFTADIRRGGVPCWYHRLNLTEEQRRKVDAAMQITGVSNRKIADVLSSWGYANCGG